MSFHFNLSSSEDEEEDSKSGDELEESRRNTSGLTNVNSTAATSSSGAAAKRSIDSASSSAAAASSSPYFDKADDNNGEGGGTFAWGEEGTDDEDEGVDWEDAGDDNSGEETNQNESITITSVGSKRIMPSRDITINFSVPDDDEKKQEDEATAGDCKRKGSTKKRRKKRLIKIQTPHLARLALNIHRSHMLTLSGRAVMISACCSDSELLHVAQSLIPSDVLFRCITSSPTQQQQKVSEPIIPSEELVRQVLAWYFELVNDVEQRRRRIREENAALGAPLQAQQAAAAGGRRGRGGRGQRSRRGAAAAASNSKQRGKPLSEGIGTTESGRLLALLTYLSPSNDSDPDFVDETQRDEIGGAATAHEKAQLLVLIARSLGWRVRYVAAMQPVTRELTVNHPLFTTSMKDAFLRVMASGGSGALPRFTKKKFNDRKKKGNSKGDGPQIIDLSAEEEEGKEASLAHDTASSEGLGGVLAWVEILCVGNSTRSKRKSSSASTTAKAQKDSARWVHIDPERKIIDQPSVVESLITRLKNEGSESKSLSSPRRSGARAKSPVSYVLAVEHTLFSCASGDTHAFCRLTDVTRRYSGAWSQALRLRGATGQQIVSSNGKCVDSWWADTLRKANRLSKRKARSFLDASGSEQQQKVKGEDKKRSPSKLGSNKASCSSSVSSSKGEAIVIDDSASEREDNIAVSLLDRDEHADAEKIELAASAADESIPTSKAAFKKHPLYAIPSILNKAEVIDPDGKKRIAGIFKGELIYRRADISVALTAKKWLYQGRKVKDAELSQPAKKVKARQKLAPESFRALTTYGVTDDTEQKIDDEAFYEEEYDGMDKLYGKWQTDKWSLPPVGPNDAIPVNEYKNVEKALLNPGLVHLELTRISLVAKKLCIPYAPCLLGFEGHGGNRTPTIRGIVVHEHNADLLREAHTEWESQGVEQEHEQRRKSVYKRWKRLIVGVLTKERLERQYGTISSET